jgi:hypothetical protein
MHTKNKIIKDTYHKECLNKQIDMYTSPIFKKHFYHFKKINNTINNKQKLVLIAHTIWYVSNVLVDWCIHHQMCTNYSMPLIQDL